jgi:hypothetical protein
LARKQPNYRFERIERQRRQAERQAKRDERRNERLKQPETPDGAAAEGQAGADIGTKAEPDTLPPADGKVEHEG